MNHAIKFLFLGMSLYMTYLAIITSMQSDMFHLSPAVVNEPWFKTTLVDFYFNIILFSSWVIYKEDNKLRSLMWILGFILFGSIATCLYVSLQFFILREGEGMKKVLLRRSEA